MQVPSTEYKLGGQTQYIRVSFGLPNQNRWLGRDVKLSSRILVNKESTMERMPTWRRTVMALALAVVVAAGIVAAQTTPASRTTSSPDQLVAEVRELRAEIQQAAANSLRAQIVMGRLQLEEQRINLITAQLTETRRAIFTHDLNLAKPMEAVKNAEHLLAIGNRNEAALADARAQLAMMQQEAERLRAEEARLLNQLTTEQQRWTEFSARLDALERETSTPRR
jgi:hypothetical protein